MIIDRSDDAGLYQLRFYNAPVTRYVFIVILNFVALDREPGVVAAVVAGHVIVLQPQYIECETKAQVLVAVKRQSSGLKPLRFGNVRGFLNTRRDIGTDIANRDSLNRCDEGKLVKIDAQRRTLSPRLRPPYFVAQ